MNAKRNAPRADNSIERNGGPVWHKLHSEREDVYEALIRDGVKPYRSPVKPAIDQDAVSAANWHQNLLQARLRKIDEAMDRLMTGSYGNCCMCGRWIQDTKLEFDPAVAFCVECWERNQTEH